MSKIEEALEKASKLREPDDNNGGKIVYDTSNIELRKTKITSPYMVTVTQPDSPVSEEYRRLKSIVIRETKTDFLNTIMVTSAVEGEGKSLTAVNLAISLAQEIDHTILLIDADIRKPRAHEYLGIDYKYGLSEFLTQDLDLSEVLIKTDIGNLLFLPAGHSVENPAELLASDKMKALIREVKHRYMDRYVIIDTPPVLPFADTIAVGSLVDGVIFVVKEGRVTKKLLEDAMNMMKDLRILGTVFNQASVEDLDGHYSNYYKYKKYKKKVEK
ncbi:MAG: polysaccharide biosynthesis tyrosine autokinase [Nitrospirae bacterium]|nr:polysaccharide biosynthesis tyrosine autokinase [Nitrospirota bacterium]